MRNLVGIPFAAMKGCFMKHIISGAVFGAMLVASAAGAEGFTVTEGRDWKRSAAPLSLTIIPGSVLDLTDVTENRLQKLSIRNGRFVGEDGRPVRFFADAEVFMRRVHGFHSRTPEFDTPERIDLFCKELRRRGFNMVRAHKMDGSLMRRSKTDFKPLDSEIDAFCRVVEAFNRNGIYLNLDIAGSVCGWYAGPGWAKKLKPGQKTIGKRKIYVSEESRQAWIRGCRFLFGIRNPYTGRLLRDEPCMALAVAYNEQEFGFSVSGDGYDDCAVIYRDWLKKRYGDIAKFNAARGKSYASFDEVPVFKPENYRHQPIRERDMDVHQFMDDAQISLTRMYTDRFREVCPSGFISNWNMAKDLRQMSLRKYCDFVSVNGYCAHPFSPRHFSRRNRGRAVPAGAVKAIEGWSVIGDTAKLARAFAACRLQGKPFVVTEYSIGWWSRHRYELGFVIGAYAAMQGWDGLTPFAENTALYSAEVPLLTFEHWRDPVIMAQNFVTALAFMRGDVKESDLRIRWAVDRQELLKSPHSSKALSDAQSEFALVGSVALAVDESPEKGSFSMKAASGAEIRFQTEGFQDAANMSRDEVQKKAGRSIADRLRSSGMLPSGNATDPEKGVFESSTGELYLDAERSFMSVQTPRLQGICGRGGEKTALKDFIVKKMSRDGNLFVAARDGMRPISEAERLVVGYVTDVQNTGLKLADEEGCFLIDPGKAPRLYATGSFTVSVRNSASRKLRAWAVGNNGARLAEIPLKKVKDGVVLSVDTAELPCGPVFFFELAAK